MSVRFLPHRRFRKWKQVRRQHHNTDSEGRGIEGVNRAWGLCVCVCVCACVRACVWMADVKAWAQGSELLSTGLVSGLGPGLSFFYSTGDSQSSWSYSALKLVSSIIASYRCEPLARYLPDQTTPPHPG